MISAALSLSDSYRRGLGRAWHSAERNRILGIPLIERGHNCLVIDLIIAQLVSERDPSRSGVVFPAKQFQFPMFPSRSQSFYEIVNLVWLP